MHKSLDYVCGFSRMSQCSRNITHGFSGISVYQIKCTVNKQKNIENAVIYCIHIPLNQLITADCTIQEGKWGNSAKVTRYILNSQFHCSYLDSRGVPGKTPGLYIITKRQVHFLSFIDKTMHKSLDYVCGFSRMSQCSRNITHGFSGTSVYQNKQKNIEKCSHILHTHTTESINHGWLHNSGGKNGLA
jgi:hypothetical protein